MVYPQGLNTPGKLTDPEGKKPGWQHGPGAEGDRDLKFFDAMLAEVRGDYKVDDTPHLFHRATRMAAASPICSWAHARRRLHRLRSECRRRQRSPRQADSSRSPCCTSRARMIRW